MDFAHIIEPYLNPRLTGINKLSIYVDGYSRYLRDTGEERIAVDAFGGDNSYKVAAEKVKRQIDAGLPIPFLTLRHKDKRVFVPVLRPGELCSMMPLRMIGSIRRSGTARTGLSCYYSRSDAGPEKRNATA